MITTKQKEPVLTIPIGDWMKEYVREEVKVTTEEDIIGLLVNEKRSTVQVARLIIVAREAGQAPEGIIPANKPLLNTGGAMAIQSMLTQRYREKKLKNGKVIKVREFVAPVKRKIKFTKDGQAEEEVNGDKGIVSVESDIACERALKYLSRRVPGYIYGRLKVVAVNGGDITEAADALKREIDEMVSKLT